MERIKIVSSAVIPDKKGAQGDCLYSEIEINNALLSCRGAWKKISGGGSYEHRHFKMGLSDHIGDDFPIFFWLSRRYGSRLGVASPA
jgi:hypothetical protein